MEASSNHDGGFGGTGSVHPTFHWASYASLVQPTSRMRSCRYNGPRGVPPV